MFKTSPLVAHRLATEPLPPPQPALYEYLFAGNGIFLRANRHGLAACIPLLTTAIHGLPNVEPSISLAGPRIPLAMMREILLHAQLAWADSTGPKESLFHCGYQDTWTLTIPQQIRTYASVHCADPYAPSYQHCLIEIHSHHEMPPFFSSTDDQDETGFRIYGVLGHLHRRPQILFRVGIYSHFSYIPAASLAELPEGLEDALPHLNDDPLADATDTNHDTETDQNSSMSP